MENVTREEILGKAYKLMESHPCLRFGQSVFNLVDSEYGVARHVQFVDNVDCFYDDSKVDDFINHALYAVNVLKLGKK